MNKSRKPIVSIIGRSGEIPQELESAAYEVGKRLAEKGIAIVCGGRDGVMEAACKGAKSAGGTTIGIAMSYDRDESNEFVDYVIPTGIGFARNVCVVASGDLVIAIGGGFGTLSEIAHATYLNIRVIGLHSWKKLEGYQITHEIETYDSVDEVMEIVCREFL